ncbi:MAG: hypothetical protein ACO1SV_24955 [Fimbriimonas sp.]
MVGCAIFGGAGIIVFGLFLTWLFVAGGVMRGTYTRDVANNDRITDAGTMNLVPLALLVIVVGCLMVGGGLFYGRWFEKRATAGPRQKIEYFRILARFATDRRGNHLVGDWEIEAEDRVRYYVRATYPNAAVGEYEVSPEVYHSCGEGMTGEAEIQGRWIGRFIPYIGS